MRVSFFIQGKKVQNVGLRAKIMLLINSVKLVGFAENVPAGSAVSIEVWGSRESLLNFYQTMEKQKPKDSILTPPFFDDEKMPSSRKEMRSLMHFQLEQMDKFIGVGKELRKEISEMGKQMKQGFRAVVTAIQQ